MPPAFRNGDLRHADAFLPHPVQIRVIGQADLVGGFDHFFKQGHLVARRIGYAQGAIAPAQRIIAAIIAFHALEYGQHIIPAPATISKLRPMIIILWLAAHEHHTIDRRSAPQHLAARHFNAPPAGTFIRFRRKAPIHRWIANQFGYAGGYAGPEEITAFSACFKQQHLVLTALAQSGSECTAGGAGANDNEVVHRAGHALRSPLNLPSPAWTWRYCGIRLVA